ncbi:MAG TPA: hypothetical protein VMU26_23785 [Candidatus Polarisedimenticolia bacterium]|nr:hypothetical protein [Candidatus Polarisedimenticolia bacterium]
MAVFMARDKASGMTGTSSVQFGGASRTVIEKKNVVTSRQPPRKGNLHHLAPFALGCPYTTYQLVGQ